MGPWLSIITCTAREKPRFDLMIGSLLAYGPVEWVVVDALLWYDEERRRCLANTVTGRLPLQHLTPKPTPWQGPARAPEHSHDLPHLNNARNTGIIAARGDYLLFLDDCSVLAGPWYACAEIARRRRAAMQLRYLDHWLEYEDPAATCAGNEVAPTNALSFCGSGSGAPLEAALRVNGFDEDFVGVAGDNDVEFYIRLERTGIGMLSFPGAVVAELTDGHGEAHVARNRDPRRTRLRRLQRDRERFLPYASQIDLRSARLAK